MLNKAQWLTLAGFAAGVIVLTIAAVVYFSFKINPAPPGIHLPATPAKEVAKEETVPVQVAEPVQVYRPAAKAKLKLPEHVQADTEQHVVASSKTANDERQHTITTTLDTSTGVFATYDRAEPLPWVAVNTKTQVGLFYGLKGGDPVMRLQAQQEFLQVKAVHLGVVGTIDSDSTYFVGAGAWARW